MYVCMYAWHKTIKLVIPSTYIATVKSKCYFICTSKVMFTGARLFSFEWFHFKLNTSRIINTQGLLITWSNSSLLAINVAMMRLWVCRCKLTSSHAILVTSVCTLDKGKGPWSSNQAFEYLRKAMLYEAAF